MTGEVNKNNVFTGGPDQAVTGAILRSPLGTALPTALADTLDAAFVASGYIDENGFKLTPDRTLQSIKDWALATIRDALQEFNATMAWAHLETAAASMKNYAGDANVTVTAADSTHGTRIKAALNGVEPAHWSWAIRIKDGSRKMLIIAPDASLTKQEALEFKKAQAVKWGMELKTYPDGNGNYVYIYTDDGVVTA